MNQEKQEEVIQERLLTKKDLLGNNQIPKLLIIQCSDSKNQNGYISNHINYNFGNELNKLIIERKNYYKNLLNNQPNYFAKKNLKYCKSAFVTDLKMPAINRYNGRLCNEELSFILLDKIKNKNLHLLIISGLYGLLKYDDEIIDYHLEMKKEINWYEKIIHGSVNNYIKENDILDECVFYSVGQKNSPSKYYDALNPKIEWTDLWMKGVGLNSLTLSSKIIKDLLLPLI
jgi:hypothetical protein